MNDFATSFNQADVLIIAEIYPAGEEPIPGISGRTLFDEVQQFGHKDVRFEPDMNKIPGLLKNLVKSGDIVMVLGAGNINKIIPEFIKKLEAKR
jgi:UDP-N-acetylmuramate--alanine ligase